MSDSETCWVLYNERSWPAARLFLEKLEGRPGLIVHIWTSTRLEDALTRANGAPVFWLPTLNVEDWRTYNLDP